LSDPTSNRLASVERASLIAVRSGSNTPTIAWMKARASPQNEQRDIELSISTVKAREERPVA
jgi:hypothetical protein